MRDYLAALVCRKACEATRKPPEQAAQELFELAVSVALGCAVDEPENAKHRTFDRLCDRWTDRLLELARGRRRGLGWYLQEALDARELDERKRAA